MTMKKLLFRSNLLMLVVPVIFIIILFAVFGLVANTVLFRSESYSDKMVGSLTEIQQVIEDADFAEVIGGNAEAAAIQKFNALGYHIAIYREKQLLFSNLDGEMPRAFSKMIFEQMNAAPGQALWVCQEFLNGCIETVESGNGLLTIAALSDEHWIFGRMQPLSVWGLASMNIILALSVIAVTLFVGTLLAKRMVQKIMTPLDALCEGAQRVSAGNLDEDIPCCGLDELDKVCRSFNEMQHQLSANIEKTNQYERAKNEMLAGISHDLRTPLTSMKSYVKGMIDGVANTPEKQEKYLAVAYRKSEEMEALIEQLFLFSKLETGSLPFHFKKTPIRNYMETWMKETEMEITQKDADISFTSNCGDEEVLLDAEQMNRVLNNIVSNSLKYNKGRDLHIAVKLTRKSEDVQILLQDDGVGVSDAQTERLFDSFYRGDASRTRPEDGSGLGLSIAEKIVTAHHGTIAAKNYRGLSIIITLPIV